MKKSNEKGITLIVLIITVIVLLILAGVSISAVLGDNGILDQTVNATEGADVVGEKEILSTAILSEKNNSLSEVIVASELEERIINEGKDVEVYESTDGILVVIFNDTGNVYEVDNEGNVTESITKIRDYQQTIESSEQEVIFENTITEDEVLGTVGSFDNYEIKGIALTEDGEISDSVEGLSGTLAASGDLADSTFEYTLTDFMKGDETFYIVIDVDGTNYYQKLSVIQGDCVTYEEDFAGIEYETNTATWSDDENENYSNGKAKLIDTTNGAMQFKFTFTGTGFEIISRLPESCYIALDVTLNDKYVYQHMRTFSETDSEEEFGISAFGDLEETTSFESNEYGVRAYIYQAGTVGLSGTFYLDAIKIYR